MKGESEEDQAKGVLVMWRQWCVQGGGSLSLKAQSILDSHYKYVFNVVFILFQQNSQRQLLRHTLQYENSFDYFRINFSDNFLKGFFLKLKRLNTYRTATLNTFMYIDLKEIIILCN